MPEEYNVHPEIAKSPFQNEQTVEEQPLSEHPVEEQPVDEQPVDEQPIDEQPRRKSNEELNYAALREKTERLQRERDEIEQRLQSYATKNEVQEENEDVAQPHDLVEGKTVNKLYRDLRSMKKQLEAYQRQSNEYTTEMRIKSRYPDFDEVCSKENIESFRLQYPELAESIISSGDMYKAASAAYTAIQKMGIADNNKSREQYEQRTKQNTKPRPAASLSPTQGATPLSKANEFADGSMSKELRAKLQREMYECAKKY